MKVIIQIPCYNEEATLGLTLSELPRELTGIDQVEWLIINDGSRDHTLEVAQACGVDHIVDFQSNQGLAKVFIAGIEASLKAGADIISVHAEHNASPHLHRTLGQIRELGKQAGVVLNPGTPLSLIEHVLPLCDLILIMSVNPGFGGQSFIPEMVDKVARLRKMCDEKGLDPWIEVDGGLKPNNTWQVLEAGANAIVAGSAVFKAPDYAEAIEGIRNSNRSQP